MARSKTGEAIRPDRRRPEDIAKLQEMLEEATKAGDLGLWRRVSAMLGYIEGRSVIEMAKDLKVVRGTINNWLIWYDVEGHDGLRTRIPPGGVPRLSESQLAQLSQIVIAGPIAEGYTSGVWTGPMIGDVIRKRFGVSYHNHHIPRLLAKLGFTVQRPRKRLARADAEAQRIWVKERLPAIKKKPLPAGG